MARRSTDERQGARAGRLRAGAECAEDARPGGTHRQGGRARWRRTRTRSRQRQQGSEGRPGAPSSDVLIESSASAACGVRIGILTSTPSLKPRRQPGARRSPGADHRRARPDGPATKLPRRSRLSMTSRRRVVCFSPPGSRGSRICATNIKTLRNRTICDIIVDDIFYYVESPFQDGQGAASSRSQRAAPCAGGEGRDRRSGCRISRRAGNSGNLNRRHVGHVGRQLRSTAVSRACRSVGVDSDRQTFAAAQPYQRPDRCERHRQCTLPGPTRATSGNDYDLFVLNSTGTTILGAWVNVQNGNDDPFEQLASGAGYLRQPRRHPQETRGVWEF